MTKEKKDIGYSNNIEEKDIGYSPLEKKFPSIKETCIALGELVMNYLINPYRNNNTLNLTTGRQKA